MRLLLSLRDLARLFAQTWQGLSRPPGYLGFKQSAAFTIQLQKKAAVSAKNGDNHEVENRSKLVYIKSQ